MRSSGGGYVDPYLSARAPDLNSAGARCIGRTNLEEFGRHRTTSFLASHPHPSVNSQPNRYTFTWSTAVARRRSTLPKAASARRRL